MIDDKLKEALSSHELVVIPTDGIIDMWQDELGLVRMTVGVGKSSQETGNMLIFCDHDSFHKMEAEE